MNGDFTRSTFRKEKHYTSVRMQQGRVQVDADWNEALDIGLHLDRATRRDVIGADGVPKDNAGFAVAVTPDGTDLTISAGRMYVGGVLCEVEGEGVVLEEAQTDRVVVAAGTADGRPFAVHEWVEIGDPNVPAVHVARITAADPSTRTLSIDPPMDQAEADALNAAALAVVRRVVTYSTQPDLPAAPYLDVGPGSPAKLALDDGSYVAYADVWERHVTALDDPELVETALGGPDTATRTKAVWQVRIDPVAGSPIRCEDLTSWAPGSSESDGRPASTGSMRARSRPETPTTNPCVIPPSAGYRRLENHLYRIEVHDPGPLGTATFKWSRDNASMTASWTSQAGRELTVSTTGPDEVLGFASGQLVELLDDTRELAGSPGSLVRIAAPPEGDVITVDTNVDLTQFPRNPKVRRWDCGAAVTVERPAADDGWLALEDGVQVLFEDGHYNTGDYWLVPARTAQADVEWPRDPGGASVPRPPDGIAHHYAPLALLEVSGGTVTLLDDCRDRFPSLADLTAADVAFDNARCEIPGAATVQDALDAMCEHGGLRRHNRHLHGWGIVCGLQVVCGPHQTDRRESVTVREGYAIDAEGNDLVLPKDRPLDVLDMIARLQKASGEDPLLDENGNGDFSLRLDVDLDRVGLGFAIEPYDPAKEDDLQSALAGTLLLDFYLECVKPVEDFFRRELGDGDDEASHVKGTSAAQERRSILVGLLAHVLDQDAGREIYLSTREDDILRSFYWRLRDLLQSETYCAMFDRARPFPKYALADVPMDTIFGAGNHTRIRLRPIKGGAGEAYTVGPGLNPLRPSTTINRYDLDNRVLVDQIDPIAGSNARESLGRQGTDAVRDVAFSADGRRIYAIVPTRNGRDTFFRTGEVTDDGIEWGRLETICGVRLVTLATTDADPAHVYAAGVGRGIYRIDPKAVEASADPFLAFDAAGHLRVTPEGRAVATVASGGSGRYGALVGYSLPDGSELFPQVDLPEIGRDDLAVATRRDGVPEDTAFVVVGTGSRRIVAFGLESGNLEEQNVDLGDTDVSLEVFPGTRMLLVGLEDGYCLRLVDLRSNKLVGGYVLPVQIGPSSIAVDPVGGMAYVLNDVSNTITVAPAEVLHPEYRFPFGDLARYRADILEAFVDLMGGFLQYLKDCFCHHLLVDCPDPTGEERIYLACVSVRESQVYKVCNFSKRRYVKSFPTMAYWLSAVPIAPFLDRAVEAFCCAALPEAFGRFQAKRPHEREDFSVDHEPSMSKGKPSRVRSGIFAVQDFDPLSKWADLMSKARLAGAEAFPMFRQWAGGGEKPDEPPPEDGQDFERAEQAPSAGAVYDRNADDAQGEYESKGYEVERRPLSEMQRREMVGILKAAWRPPRPDEKVVLYEDAGVVKGMTVVPLAEGTAGEAPAPRTQPARVETQEAELAELRERLDDMERRHSALLEAVRPEKIEALESEVRTLRGLDKTARGEEAEPPSGPRTTRRPAKPPEE